MIDVESRIENVQKISLKMGINANNVNQLPLNIVVINLQDSFV